MSSMSRRDRRQVGVALRAMLVLTVVLGMLYPLAITVVGQLALPVQANGSLISSTGGAATAADAVGSSLIGQPMLGTDGTPLPELFQPRPSAAGDGYDAAASGGSNWGPENADLIAAIHERRARIAEFEGVAEAEIPADALTASASGLDPAISVAYALLQVPRVAEARGLAESDVRALVESRITGRDLGFLGQESVNVLQLNLAVAAL